MYSFGTKVTDYSMLGFLFNFFKAILLITLPFVLFIRVSIYAHHNHQLHAWISILTGAGVTAILLFIYFSWIYGRITGKIGSFSRMKRRLALSLVFVFGFAVQALFYISAKNLKHRELSTEFRSLHPILRLSISTLLILDRDAVLTDAQRQPEEYRKMGLKSKKNSLHYVQSDGYVYAVDLRTKNRNEIRNQLLALYFRLMGFRTLRHIGTADHLHVSLVLIERPWAL